jgi:hypothetical protein
VTIWSPGGWPVGLRGDGVTSRPRPLRGFDPVRLGSAESAAWVAYYRRQWWTFLRASHATVRLGFALPVPDSLRAAWYVLRANQAWAPFPDNDEARATELMRRCYAIVARVHREEFDVRTAARLEIAWWRAHRWLAHPTAHPVATRDALVDALAALYAHRYGVPAATVRPAAAARAKAMGICDDWVAAGCDPTSPALVAQRRALIAGYTALRATVSAG